MNFINLLHKGNLIGAHRGARNIAPENTLSAMKASIGICDFIELDVCLSRDKVPIIIHDDTLNRTTNAKGKVCDFTVDELSEFNYGRGEKLLTLYHALEFAKENNLYLNIEIKDVSKYFRDDVVVLSILQEIIDMGMQDRILISSFRHLYLIECKNVMRNLATAALVDGKHPQKLIEYLRYIKVDAYHISDDLVDEKIVKVLREKHFFVNVYTVNDKARIDELFSMGINGVFSDLPYD